MVGPKTSMMNLLMTKKIVHTRIKPTSMMKGRVIPLKVTTKKELRQEKLRKNILMRRRLRIQLRRERLRGRIRLRDCSQSTR